VRLHLHGPARWLQGVLASCQPCLFDLVERAAGEPAARQRGMDDGHGRRGQRRLWIVPMSDEDGAAVGVNRQAERRNGGGQRTARWHVLVDRRAAFPARLERPWILHLPATDTPRV